MFSILAFLFTLLLVQEQHCCFIVFVVIIIMLVPVVIIKMKRSTQPEAMLTSVERDITLQENVAYGQVGKIIRK